MEAKERLDDIVYWLNIFKSNFNRSENFHYNIIVGAEEDEGTSICDFYYLYLEKVIKPSKNDSLIDIHKIICGTELAIMRMFELRPKSKENLEDSYARLDDDTIEINARFAIFAATAMLESYFRKNKPEVSIEPLKNDKPFLEEHFKFLSNIGKNLYRSENKDVYFSNSCMWYQVENYVNSESKPKVYI